MKKSRLLLMMLVLAIIFQSCHTQQSLSSGWDYQSQSEYSSFERYTDKGIKSNEEDLIDRKIIFSAYLSLSVNQSDTANEEIKKVALKYEGYVNKIGTDQTIIRVKSEYLEQAMDAISVLGKTLSKTMSGEDVTENFLDFQIRLDNAEKARQRYLKLLTSAENVEAALKVEKELERLNGTVDLLKGKMNRIEHLSKYSTITINLKEHKKPGILGYVGIGIYHSFKWLFVRN